MKIPSIATVKVAPKLPKLCLTLLLCCGILACQNLDQEQSRSESQSSNRSELAAKNLASSIDTVPEPASRIVELKGDKTARGSKRFMIATAHPHASAAAGDILNSGGTAIDAAIAAQAMLGLVEPQSSGIGGGGFLLYWNAAEQKLYSYEGRETAPAAVDEKLFLDNNGTPLHFFDAAVGGRAVGVPGIVAMLDQVHSEHGKLPWQDLFHHSANLARNGFVVSERLNLLIQFVPKLDARETMRNYLLTPEGDPLPPGTLLQNPDYADTLDILAREGSDAFYRGSIARTIVKTVEEDINPGALTLDDMAAYQVKQRTPLCKTVFSHRVCSMAPPSSGGTTVLAILAMLDQLAQNQVFTPGKATSVEERAAFMHLYAEASRLAFADRNTYLADSDFVDVPVQALLSGSYLRSRADKISADAVMPDAKAGTPGELGIAALKRLQPASPERASTSHLSIVDSYGNVLSLTTSVENAFGSRLMSGGFILNNQLTDFSFVPYDADQNHIANRVQGNKRPRSSMSPVVVFDANGQPVMALGSAGGTRIINHVARILFDVLALQQSLPDAVAQKHIVRIGPAIEMETGSDEALVAALQAIGHEVKVNRQTSGVHAIQWQDDGWLGVADPRREGVALGQ